MVALAQAVLAKALDNALIALTFAGADDVDLIASNENVSLEDIADVHAGNIVQTELTKGALRSDVCFVEVAFGCLVEGFCGLRQ